LQAKLLRALQEQEVEPLGSNQVVKVDVRVIAATSRDLPRLVAEGRFREDLYYRLNVVPIRLPALRERLADLEALAEALLDDISRRSGLAHRELSAEAFDALRLHPWRGNIRELRNVLEQVSMMSDDLRLTPRHFAGVLPELAAAHASVQVDAEAQPAPAVRGAGPQAAPLRPLPDQVAELERAAIRAALLATGGNRVATARLLKISRAALYDKLARWPELSA
jgi:DNA-binding NtrC family response regulator